MICSARELGLGDDHDGIIVLPAGAGEPGDDARRRARTRRRGHRVRDQPRPRLRALAARHRPRGRARRSTWRSTTRPTARRPRANDAATRSSSTTPTAARSSSPAPSPGSTPAAPTPDWMARRLAQCGMRPISLAVDVTNYVMLELGQPIHGYDRDKLAGPIGVRRGSAGEKLTTLDGTVRDVSTEDLLITDDSGPIGLAGVMGGETTEMSETTTDILIEAAHWHPDLDLPHRRRHKLPSEASRRFERGVDPSCPGRGRPGRRAAGRARRRHDRGGRDRGRRRRRPSYRLRRRRPARPRLRDGDLGAAPRWRTSRRSAATSRSTAAADRDGAALAPRPHRPVRPGRGGRPDRRATTRCRRCCRRRRPAAG